MCNNTSSPCGEQDARPLSRWVPLHARNRFENAITCLCTRDSSCSDGWFDVVTPYRVDSQLNRDCDTSMRVFKAQGRMSFVQCSSILAQNERVSTEKSSEVERRERRTCQTEAQGVTSDEWKRTRSQSVSEPQGGPKPPRISAKLLTGDVDARVRREKRGVSSLGSDARGRGRSHLV